MIELRKERRVRNDMVNLGIAFTDPSVELGDTHDDDATGDYKYTVPRGTRTGRRDSLLPLVYLHSLVVPTY